MAENVLQKDICYLKGVGPAKASLLQKLSIFTLGDLLHCYPREYRDWSRPYTVAAAPFEEKCCVKATVTAPSKEHFLPGGRRLYTVMASDDTASLRLLFFNTRYAAQSLKPGQSYLFYGKIGGGFTNREIVAPQFFEEEQAPALQPVYPLTAGLSNKTMCTIVKNAFMLCKEPFAEPLPPAILAAYHLCSFDEAVRTVHFPADRAAVQRARRRLIFQELLVLQMGMKRLKGRSRGQTPVCIQKDETKVFFDALPFSPTAAQRRVTREAVADLKKGIPMSRLVQGDVGSGKTAVAAALCHTAAANGWQCAIMAPTEILARQHYETFCRFLKPFGITVGLLTGSAKAKERREVLQGLEAGTIAVAVGTHALLEDTVVFHRLGLVITDEQHRFGVAQRGRLAAKGTAPHMLVMSATPIPRTLALMIYGDLDVSVLDELPPGRQPVNTYAVNSSYHARIYQYIRKFIKEGQQAYIVCPLVEENEEGTAGLLSAQAYQSQLQEKVFPDYTVGLLHGKMSSKEKERVMEAFAANQIQILVATTVVEVGVDVPNATVMVIENAERFGLSQLHQLRGRVGRGDQPASCILVSDHKGEQNQRRLQILCETADGFQIADEDLKMRGPGDFFGARQHGLPTLKLADLLHDTEELHQATAAAGALLAEDPVLAKPEHRLLAALVEEMCSKVTAP